MAESKGVMLAKSVQKHAGRAKEKILQNLGKVDRTADEIFDDHLNNFNRQQGNANRLQKEFNSYIRCIRAAQVASKSLMDAISEIYEPQWTGYDALQAQIAASESLWLDFAHKLGDQVLIPLNTYTGQFPEMKKKVEKRNRKLIDYDSQRHSFQSLQASANKRKDDVKLTKGREQLEEARRTYEILNTELHDELPALYDSRILFLVTNLQTLFATEQVFHSETSKIYAELEAIVDKLATDSQRGSNTFRKQAAVNAIKSGSPVQTPVKQMNNTNMNNYQNQITTNGSSNINSPTSSPSTSSQQQEVRLDPISPTPESSPEKLPSTATTAADVATVGVASIPASSTISSASTEASYQNVAAIITATETSSSATATATVTPPIASVVTTLATASPQRQPEEQENNANARNKLSTVAKATHADDDNKITSIPVAALKPMRGDDGDNDNNKRNDNDNDVVAMVKNTKAPSQLAAEQQLNGNGDINGDTNNVVVGKVGNGNVNVNGNSNVEDNKKSLDASTTDLPPGVLYRVKATYGYVKEDADELSFEIGDIIRVIEYDDPEDQEEGWLMGQKEGTDEKGLFPANFTRPI